MTLPQELNNRLQKEPQDGLFPLVEIELNEKISVEQILSALYNEHKIPYKLLKADVEYFGILILVNYFCNFRERLRKTKSHLLF
jgi:D-methionine transport system ATP-binding protein